MLSENQVIISLITFDYIIVKFIKKFFIKAHKQLHIQNYAKCKTSLLKISLFALEGEVLFMEKSEFYSIFYFLFALTFLETSVFLFQKYTRASLSALTWELINSDITLS